MIIWMLRFLLLLLSFQSTLITAAAAAAAAAAEKPGQETSPSSSSSLQPRFGGSTREKRRPSWLTTKNTFSSELHSKVQRHHLETTKTKRPRRTSVLAARSTKTTTTTTILSGSSSPSSSKCSGTRITFKPPTPENLQAWFGGNGGPSAATQNEAFIDNGDKYDGCGLSGICFNHDRVGMTYPIFDKEEAIDGEPTAATTRSPTTTNKNSTAASWPKLSGFRVGSLEDGHQNHDINHNSQRRQSNNSKKHHPSSGSDAWRTLRFVNSNVGLGWACYQAVRDAALQWEFTTNHAGEKGIRIVPTMTQQQQPAGAATTASQRKIMTGRKNTPFPGSGPDTKLEPGQHMVTYTTFLGIHEKAGRNGRHKRPLLYVVNPVAMVYKVMDRPVPHQQEQGPTTRRRRRATKQNESIYTSTAYATCHGHWLCGEERVTVMFTPSNIRKSGGRGRARQNMNRKGDDGLVQVEIVSCSKPANSFMGRLVWPLIGNMQKQFFLQELEHLANVGKKSDSFHKKYSVLKEG